MTKQNGYKSEYEVRLERLNSLKKSGINPYPKAVSRTHQINEVLVDFKFLEKKKTKPTLAGRVRSIRLHGGSCFVSLQDESGLMQIYFKKDEIGEKDYAFFTDSFDVGDFIEATGTLFKTKREEKTLLVKSFKMLTKALLPLPEKWHGLADTETRFRKRYLDLIANPEVMAIFKKRSQIIQFIRNYFIDQGFIEVDTPILQEVASGAIAKPFKTYHNALDMDLYLRIAPEIYLKELVIGGFEKVFEIARCFRNEGIDYSHNPEFTQIEFYWAYKDYEDLMKVMEIFMEKLVKEVNNSTKTEYDGQQLNFKGPYPRLDFREALLKETGIDLDKHDDKSLQEEAQKKGLKVESFWGKGKLADELFKEFVRPKMINPTYIINHPIELSPLAKKIEGRENYVQRFQLIVAGRFELMNAFSELNDPLDQEERFKFQQFLAGKGDDEAMGKDDQFVEALKYGMPPMAGLGMGIDRLTNVLTNTHNIKEVILFPTLKPEGNSSQTLATEDKNSADSKMVKSYKKNKPPLNRAEALKLVKEKIKEEHLVKHCLTVEAIMRAMARHFNEDEERWGLAGLLHDIDYEETKADHERHSLEGGEFLAGLGFDEEIVQAVKAHNEIHGLDRDSLLAKVLYAVDPISGFITAVSLVYPSQKLADVKVKSITKRLKEKRFAAGASREGMESIKEVGLDFTDFAEIALKAMQEIADELGL